MRKILKAPTALIAGSAMAFTVTMATEMPASAATSCNTSISTYSTIKRGSTGSKTRAAECLLRSVGYSVSVNGSFSSTDVTKLKAFQKSRKLSQTGTVTSTTWTALLSRGSKPTLRVGSTGGSVSRLQKALTASGRRVPTTGYYGSITSNAVKSLQRARGLSATGTTTISVWRALQAGGRATVSGPMRSAPPRAAVSSGSRGAKALAFAKNQLGDSYQFGAMGPNSWDCSGLTSGAWKAAGVTLPRTSQAQYRFGTKVSRANLRPGDLVFFYSGISHVAIYAGNGKVVQASRPGRPINVGNISDMPYMGARRPG